MAVTGFLLIGFVVAHLVGNLQVFLGAEVFNAYAAFLKSIPGPLWIARIGLIVIFVLHLYNAFSLRKIISAARPVDYNKQATVQASAASRYMLHTGVVILLFVIVHLAHFTLGYLQPEHFSKTDALGQHDVYYMLVQGFLNPVYAGFYIFCIVMLGIHLSHGISSMFQTLGFCRPNVKNKLELAAKAIAAGITLGYISIPLAVIANVVTLS